MDRPQRARVALARLFWTFIAPLLLILLTLHIFIDGTGWHTPADYAFFVIVAGMVFARWFEFRDGNPLTMTGEPASWSDFYRFVWVTALGGACVWVLANAFGNHGAVT